MKIVFVSNYFNHHQKSLSEAWDKLINHNYYFIARSEMSEERRKLGYGGWKLQDYVIQSYLNEFENEKSHDALCCSDVIIAGSASEEMLRPYIQSEKLLFRYSERPFKRGFSYLKYIPRFIKWHHQNPSGKPIYMLCSSAYTSFDYAKFGLYKNKCYKWGYFPECKKYDDINSVIKSKSKQEILWCGRFLDWKHPDDAVRIAKRLYDDGYNFKLNIIGTGEMESDICKLIEENHLGGYITLLGSMPPEKVREHMEKAGIYLFTSDRQEGWGAVLNESMNSGCAVVASHAIGSVPYLLKDGKNGYIYESGNVDELYEKVKYLLDNPSEQERVGKAAYRTITKEWNAEIAAERFINLAELILNGKKSPDLYESGPCSKAEIIKDNWYKNEI